MVQRQMAGYTVSFKILGLQQGKSTAGRIYLLQICNLLGSAGTSCSAFDSAASEPMAESDGAIGDMAEIVPQFSSGLCSNIVSAGESIGEIDSSIV